MSFRTTHDKTTPLHTNPHYTDDRFNREQTVFGKPSKSPYGHGHLEYNYSDRLWQWDYDKSKRSSEIASASSAPLKSCLWYEAYLSAYFSRPVTIEHIIAGVNHSNGFAYCIFGSTKETG